MRRCLCGLAGVFVLLAWGGPAAAVIKVDFPVSKVYSTSGTVVIGSVRAVQAANCVVDVAVTAKIKGDLGSDRFRVQIRKPAGLIGQVATGRPVVLFVAKAKGGSAALLHVADTWLLASRVHKDKATAWRVVQPYDGKQSFPGRTAALARLVGEIRAGKPTLLDKAEHNVFRGGVRDRGKLPVARPTFLLTGDVNGDGKVDLLVGTVGGVRLLLAGAAGYEDATAPWGLSGAAASPAATGDVNGDGKVDLLLGSALWVQDEGKFAAAAKLPLPGDVRALAATLADVTGDEKPDAAVALPDGRLLAFENPGRPGAAWTARPQRKLWARGEAPLAAAFGDWGDNGRPHLMVVRAAGVTRYALDADGGPPADDVRLTGAPLKKYHKAHGEGLKNVLAAAIDVNGDGRRDFFVLADGGGLMLVNRGFGAFLVNPDAGGPVTSRGRHRVPFKLDAATAWTAADLHGDRFEDLLILTPDGQLYEVSNTPFPLPR